MNAAFFGDSEGVLVEPVPRRVTAAIDDLTRARDLLVVKSDLIAVTEWPDRYRAAAKCSARLAGWWGAVACHVGHVPAGLEVHRWAAERVRDDERAQVRRWRTAARAAEHAVRKLRAAPASCDAESITGLHPTR